MDLQQALLLLVAIADEGSTSYSEEYKNGTVEKAIETVDNFLNLLSKVNSKIRFLREGGNKNDTLHH